MKHYLGKYTRGKNKGTYGISFVLQPAMEGDFIALKKQQETEIQLKVVDDEKRIVVGLVLEPEKEIYRNQNGEEFTISFKEQDIVNMCHDFTLFNNNTNSTIEHDISRKLENVCFAENWIVIDEKIDTAVAYGLTPKKGSWMSIAKIEDDNLWQEIKLGKVKGFSIDAMLSLEEVNLKSNIEMSNTNTLLERILLALTPTKEVEVKLGSIMLADGSIKIDFDGDTLSEGISCWVTADDGTKVPVPVGEHPLEDGTVLVVEQEGIVKSITPVAVEEEPVPVVEAGEAGKVSNDAKIASEIESAIKSILIKYTAQEEKIATLENQIAELSKQPASKPIQGTPIQVDFSKMTPKERISYTLNKNKN